MFPRRGRVTMDGVSTPQPSAAVQPARPRHPAVGAPAQRPVRRRASPAASPTTWRSRCCGCAPAFVRARRARRGRRARLRAAVDLRAAGAGGRRRATVPRTERQQALGLIALAVGIGLAAATLGDSVIGWVVGPLGVAAVGAAVVWREADEPQRRRWTSGGAGRPAAQHGAAGAGRGGLRDRRDRGLPARQHPARPGPVRPAGRAGHAGRGRRADRAVVAEAGPRAGRGAPGADRRGRARGDRRAPARLGAADPGADPAAERPAARGAAAGPRPGARAAALALRPDRVRAARARPPPTRRWTPAWPTRSPRPRPRSRTPTPSTCARSWSATPSSTTACAPWCWPPARPWSTRPSTPRWTRSACTSRSSRPRCTCSCATAGSASTRTRCPADRHGLADSVHGRMTRHGGTVRLRTTPGEGTEVHLAMPRGRRGRPRGRGIDHE